MEWISVSERLPDANLEVEILVHFPFVDEANPEWHTVVNFDGEFWWDEFDAFARPPDYWMSIPPLPVNIPDGGQPEG